MSQSQRLPNPFRPGQGATPPLLVGRADDIRDFEDGILDGTGAHGRFPLYTGARGVGKTVMLSEAVETAHRYGWRNIDETTTPGLLARLDEQVTFMYEEYKPRKKWRATGFTLAPVGAVSIAPTPALTAGLRRKMALLMDEIQLASPGSGLLVTIDEIHASSEDLREFAAIMQHYIREDRDIAVAMAGLPSSVSTLLSDGNDNRITTFLRRADKKTLGDVDIAEIRAALVQTIEENGREISAEAADFAAQATYGYPFLIQLVGHRIWRATDNQTITLTDAQQGVERAKRSLGELVHETALGDLSSQDKTFLLAMAADDGPVKMKDVRERMGSVTKQHANTYRERLLAAKVITQPEHGLVDFALPYMRAYLREHAAAIGINAEQD